MAMKEMASEIRTVDRNTGAGIKAAARQQVESQRAASVPGVALVSNFDVDRKDFLTETFKGFLMVQKGNGAGTYGTLAVQAGYNDRPPDKDQKYQVTPGAPVLVYPAAAQTGALNTSLVYNTGVVEPKRYYPVVLLLRGDGPVFFRDS